jgi:predicted alpha/beta hydrolase
MPEPACTREQLTVPATDGFPLAATLLEPAPGEDEGAGATRRPRAAVVIAPAMGVRKRYYEPFAAYLAGAGFAVLCFDYRGMGGSLPGRLRGFPARFRDWGERDLDGALAWLGERWPEAPLLVVGHSAGGQILGLARRIDRVGALLGVAAQSGHWRYWPGAWRWVIALFWYVGLPVLVALFGYLPMRLTTGGENVPAGVAREWARWGRRRDYVLSYARARGPADPAGATGGALPAGPGGPGVAPGPDAAAGATGTAGAAGYDRFDRPLRAYGFTDDLLAPPGAVAQLLAFYPRARSELRVLAPADLGVAKIGHFDPFRERFRDSLWAEWRAWLAEVAE